ncbi:MAG TPA: carbohydrate ABC transporter permease [Actinomycetota bacterium]
MAATDVDVFAPSTAPAAIVTGRRRRLRPQRVVLHAFLIATCLIWLAPLAWTVYTSLRPYQYTADHGYFSIGGHYGFDNFTAAWSQADLIKYYGNTLLVTVPAVLLTLLLASFVAFAVARFSWRFNIALLMVFTAGNLLPQQVIITPLYRLFLMIPLPTWMNATGTLYDSYWGIIAIHVAFQTGFCTFVLSNYMRTIPHELTEAALVDGASVWRQFWRIIMPLTRPALAALATLEFIFIYNDFFWAVVLMQSQDKRPITSALLSLQGIDFTNDNLIAAGALLAALPTLVVYFTLQRQFVRGLTLGATKG